MFRTPHPVSRNTADQRGLGYAPGMEESPPAAADLDLGLVRSFTVVAERLHFGHAAEALHVSPSSLSRQITRLERQVGARLLERTPRGTRLTVAGQAFVPLAAEALRLAARATASARAAAQPNVVTIGFIMNLAITPAVRELRRQHPDAEVRTQYLEPGDVPAALLEHRVDAAVARLPFRTDGLDVTILYDEPRVLAVPRGHRLAGKESITIDDLADEPLPRSADPAWDAFWRVDPRPDGRPAPGGPFIKTAGDKIELVASGQAAVILPATVPLASVRPDLTTIPIENIEPSHVALATRAGDRARLVTAFRKHARSQLAGFAAAAG
jgi:DNA-binding transcriptional LysR family regulator